MKAINSVQAAAMLIVAIATVQMGESTVTGGRDPALIRRLGCGTAGTNPCQVDPDSCCCKGTKGEKCGFAHVIKLLSCL